MNRYEIVEGSTATGTKWWSVIAYEGDRCLGGDAHWLSRQHAEDMKLDYEEGRRNHGTFRERNTELFDEHGEAKKPLEF